MGGTWLTADDYRTEMADRFAHLERHHQGGAGNAGRCRVGWCEFSARLLKRFRTPDGAQNLDCRARPTASPPDAPPDSFGACRKPPEPRTSTPTPLPGLRLEAVALRAAQNSGLPCSSDRRAPDPLRQSADGFALWSQPETRYLRLPSPLRRNTFPPDASALWSTFGRGSALVDPMPLKPATLLPSSPTICRSGLLKRRSGLLKRLAALPSTPVVSRPDHLIHPQPLANRFRSSSTMISEIRDHLRSEFHLNTVRTRLEDMTRRVAELEAENDAQRAYIAYDEEWHFRDMLADVARGVVVEEHIPRLTWLEFLDSYNGTQPDTSRDGATVGEPACPAGPISVGEREKPTLPCGPSSCSGGGPTQIIFFPALEIEHRSHVGAVPLQLHHELRGHRPTPAASRDASPGVRLSVSICRGPG